MTKSPDTKIEPEKSKFANEGDDYLGRILPTDSDCSESSINISQEEKDNSSKISSRHSIYKSEVPTVFRKSTNLSSKVFNSYGIMGKAKTITSNR